MNRFALFLALALVGVVFVSADSSAPPDGWLFRPVNEPLNELDLCTSVGVLSGCSGCEHGTKNLCTWMTHFTLDPAAPPPPPPPAKRSISESEDIEQFRDFRVHYHCRPTSSVSALLEENKRTDTNDRWFVSSTHCPVDPVKEPISRERQDEPLLLDQSLAVASTFHSQAFGDDLADFSHTPWTVDRTAFYSVIGNARFGITESIHLDCNDVTDQVNFNAILQGTAANELDKYCVRIALSAYLSSRCPEYGVAVSGICQSYAEQIRANCRYAGAGPQLGYAAPISMAFEAYEVVPDGTPYCLNAFPVQPTHKMETMAGLNSLPKSYGST